MTNQQLKAHCERSHLTQERLKSLLNYDPDNGVWTWLVMRNQHARAGSRAGTLHPKGYRLIEIDGRSYRSARLAYLYMTGSYPAELIDHIDHQRDNDTWINLRPASHSQNQHNQRMHSNNTSGIKGVSWHKQVGKWFANISINGKQIYLGLFADIDDAAAAINKARAEMHGDFACNGERK